MYASRRRSEPKCELTQTPQVIESLRTEEPILPAQSLPGHDDRMLQTLATTDWASADDDAVNKMLRMIVGEAVQG